ncbi:hypothetical protein pb186bvf_013276 [Paramecium bursaria]
MKNNSASKVSPKSNNLRKSAENLPPFDKEASKLSHLEINLNRVCLQQDALMPLLQMIEYIPAIQRTDSVVKGLLRKIEENEAKILKAEKQLEQRMKEPSEGNKDLKKQQKQINDLHQKSKDMEHQMLSLQRWYETKLKEESQTLQRNMEQKIEKSNTRLHESSKRVNTETSKHSKQGSITIPQDKTEYQNGILFAVEQIVQQSLASVRNDIQQQINQLREEVIQSKQN